MNYKTKVIEKLSIYKSAKTSSDRIGTCKKGEKVTIENEKTDANGNTWGKVTVNKKTGYIMLYNKKKKKELTTGKASVGKGKDYETANMVSGNWNNTKIKMSNLKTMGALETSGDKLSTTMQLFGIPYQFTDSVDCRVEEVSPCYGRKFAKNFVLGAPVVTILPGKPKYLPGEKDKQSITEAFIDAGAGNLGPLKQLSSDKSEDNKDIRLYDFETAYIEYMQYVNILCRTCASFLELDRNKADKIYKINDDYPDFLGYDWKDYRWNGKKYRSTIGNIMNEALDASVETTKNVAGTVFDGLKNFGSAIASFLTGDDSGLTSREEKAKENAESTITTGTQVGVNTGYDNNNIEVNDATYYMTDEEKSLVENLGRKTHYVQFYCDPSGSNYNDSQSNSTQSSTLKGALDQGSSVVKEIQFLANSGGVDSSGLEKFGQGFIDGLSGFAGAVAGPLGAGSLVSRLKDMLNNVISGENIIMPDFFSGSSRSATVSLSIPLKPVYGNKYSYYMDFLVPLMHILPLVIPAATSGNTYSSPFLVKVYIRGQASCNLGLVTSMGIQWEDSFNADGLPMGATVTLEIQDLYADMGLTPSNHPFIFVNNSSLIEYLATKCGLNLLESTFTKKINLLINNLSVLPSDVVDSAIGKIGQKVDEILYNFSGL